MFKYFADILNNTETLVIRGEKVNIEKNNLLFGQLFIDFLNIKSNTLEDILTDFCNLPLNEDNTIFIRDFCYIGKEFVVPSIVGIWGNDFISSLNNRQYYFSPPTDIKFITSLANKFRQILNKLQLLHPLFSKYNSNLTEPEFTYKVGSINAIKKFTQFLKECNIINKNFIWNMIVRDMALTYSQIFLETKHIEYYKEKVMFCYNIDNNKKIDNIDMVKRDYIFSNFINKGKNIQTKNKKTHIEYVRIDDNDLVNSKSIEKDKDIDIDDILEYYKNDNRELKEVFNGNDIREFLNYCYDKIVKKGCTIKKCENCGRLFITALRTDEVYCKHVNENGKTCQQVGYINKVKDDDVLRIYRTAYKTQHAKMQRNRHIQGYKENVYDVWKKAAQQKRNLAKEGKITTEEFEKWIKNC